LSPTYLAVDDIRELWKTLNDPCLSFADKRSALINFLGDQVWNIFGGKLMSWGLGKLMKGIVGDGVDLGFAKNNRWCQRI
jgi:hypothetical protein